MSNGKNKIIIVAIIIVLIAVAAGAFYINNAKKQGANPPPITTPLPSGAGNAGEAAVGEGATVPEKAVEIYLKAQSEQDIEKFVSVLSPQTRNEMMDNISDVVPSDEEVIAKLSERMEMPKIEIVEINVIEVDMFDEERYNNFIEAYKSSSYSKDTSHGIEAFARVKYSATVVVNEQTDTSDAMMTCCKIGDKWYIVSM